ncbi:hypothetical protein G7078_03405 [Sphingomonas sinipercae]|uniref:Lipoprotein n=1 Tax=Sphingomonas sinipercae TaxID=2714944 RepID=A0A6G7ZLY8_9SPHN|nr:hypothetical protein [Sphingomonas sinipercae]QIL01930.1 hypothetical protein G7078_03405 [Sphingomonas sinipercae]
MKTLAIASAAAFLLTGCAAYPPAVDPTAAGCPIAGSSDWAAWVNAMPGPNAQPTLIVTGKVTTPTGGYRVEFDPQALSRRSEPVQMVATLRVTPPTGFATQALVTHDVRGQWASPAKVGAVDIVCDGQLLQRISPVTTAM